MKGLLWVLALFSLAVGVSLASRYNEGYVLLVYPPYRTEITLNFTILLLFVAFLAFYFLLRTLTLTLSLPGRVREFRARHQREKAAREFFDVARLMFEGRYAQVLKKASTAHTAGQTPALTALLAAYATQRLREPAKQKEWLARAAQADPKVIPACLMLEAELLIEIHRFDEAIDVLKRLQESAGRHIAAMRLELRAQQGSGNWDEVLRIVRLLDKRNALVPELVREIKLKAHRENIRQRRDDLPALQAYQKKMPSSESTTRLARDFAEALIALGAHTEAQRYIEGQLNKEWDSRLIALYGLSRGVDLTARLAWADKLLPAHPDDPQLLLALGRMCIEQRIWGKAQSYLEASLSLADGREVRLELARFYELTERPAEAMPHFRAAAELPA